MQDQLCCKNKKSNNGYAHKIDIVEMRFSVEKFGKASIIELETNKLEEG